MKIFLSFLQSPHQHPIPAYGFWEYYIKNGIEEAGYQWMECPGIDWALGLVPKSNDAQALWRQDAWEKTVAYLKQHPADLFLSYLYPEQIETSAIKEIQKLGIPCVNFFCDNIRNFKSAPAEFAPFSLNWVPEYKAVPMYKKAGYQHINLPMPVWIVPGLRLFKAEKNKQITFIGSKDIQRHLLFESIVHQEPDLPLYIYGNGWTKDYFEQASAPIGYNFNQKLVAQYNFIKQQGISAYARKLKQRNYITSTSAALKLKFQGFPSADEYNDLNGGSMITVGINRYPSYKFPLNRPDTYSRLRDLEAPMLGACYLTEWAAGIDELYNLGTEIETYKTAEEFLYKVKELQNDTGKRKTLKINGQQKALSHHSIPASLNKIKQVLGL